MPRAKAFDPDEALDRALGLFWERGYDATSMRDLVDRMGINRFSLYSTFGDKRQLFRAALVRYRERFVDEIVGPLEAENAGLEAIEAYFRRAIEMYASDGGWRGCLFVNCAVDGPNPDHDESRDAAAAHLRRMEDAFRQAVVRARDDGTIRDGRSAEDVARFLLATSMGIGVLARAQADRATLEQAAGVALETLTG